MRYFVAVAEELHFGRAAKRMHIVQPALSQQVQSLEEELGVELLHRTTRQVRLTESGQVFLEEARRTLEQGERAAEAARRAARGQIGLLAVGFMGPATYSVLPDILKAYKESFPEVEMALHEWTSVEQVRRLHGDSIQVGFLRPPIGDDELVVEPILREPAVAVLPDGHPLTARETVPLEMLANEPFVLVPRSREPAGHDYYVGLCRRVGFSPRVVQESHQISTIVGLVAAGLGVSLLPASAAKLRRPGAVYKTIEGQQAGLELAVSWRRGDRSPVLQGFLDTVRRMTPPLEARGHPVRRT